MTKPRLEIAQSALDRIKADPYMISFERFANLCTIYATVRPVLVAVKSLLFFKPSWRKAITILIAASDAACLKA